MKVPGIEEIEEVIAMTDKSVREVIANTDVRTMRSGNFELATVGGHNADTILTALEAGGFAVVPREPTEAMLLAMHDGPLGADNEMGPHQRAWLREMYEAALAASNPKEEGSDN